jgi:NAD(P)H-hydrate epimerase
MAAPRQLNDVFQQGLHEAMTLPLIKSRDFLEIGDYEQLRDFSSKCAAVILGPGIGFDPKTVELALKIYHQFPQTIVVDADALTILASHRDTLEAPAGPRIFTPHPGELARLLRTTPEAINADRLSMAAAGCELLTHSAEQDAVMVLKGAGTLVATGNGHKFINTTGNPGMACGGMGDVLCGVIGALLCQGFPSLDASLTGVFLHGLAADFLYEAGGPGFSASEVADQLPRARKTLKHGNQLTRL